LQHGNPDTSWRLSRGTRTTDFGGAAWAGPGGCARQTVTSQIRITDRCVIACASKPSPMNTCAIAYDGREAAQRALAQVARFGERDA